jgi:hypothetical protein
MSAGPGLPIYLCQKSLKYIEFPGLNIDKEKYQGDLTDKGNI